MAALHRAASEDSGRRRNWLLGIADASAGRSSDESDEIAELRERLAAAEQRAEEAEIALPHLMELGQKTVDGLLNDARRRGREIIDASRARAEEEFAATREEVRKESRELDALRMAVAAEAMGLEQVRAELQRRISSSAAELNRMAEHPRLLGGQLPVEELSLADAAAPLALDAGGERPIDADADADVDADAVVADAVVADVDVAGDVDADVVVADVDVDVDGDADAEVALEPAATVVPEVPVDDVVAAAVTPIGLVEAATTPSASVEAQIEIAGSAEATLDVSGVGSSPTPPAAPTPPADPNSPFAAAWAAGEDDTAAEAFDRFFSADVEYEPSREWILADDTKE